MEWVGPLGFTPLASLISGNAQPCQAIVAAQTKPNTWEEGPRCAGMSRSMIAVAVFVKGETKKTQFHLRKLLCIYLSTAVLRMGT